MLVVSGYNRTTSRPPRDTPATRTSATDTDRSGELSERVGLYQDNITKLLCLPENRQKQLSTRCLVLNEVRAPNKYVIHREKCEVRSEFRREPWHPFDDEVDVQWNKRTQVETHWDKAGLDWRLLGLESANRPLGYLEFDTIIGYIYK